jgi:hypothetical protein
MAQNTKKPGQGKARPKWKRAAKVAQTHTDLIARQDALSHLRNAAVLANAGFATALELAVKNADADHVDKCIKAAEATLDAALEQLKDVDAVIEKRSSPKS